jgi:hypothetical protein
VIVVVCVCASGATTVSVEHQRGEATANSFMQNEDQLFNYL